MTVALTDGPLALEATHVWTPGDGGDPIVLNDLSAALPRVEFTRMPGFRALPDADDNRQPRTSRIGESPLPGSPRGKTFTPEGFIVGMSVRQLRQLTSAMLAAFGERDLEGTWAAIPNPAYGDTTHFWETRARVLQFEPDEEFTLGPGALPSPYQLHFLLGLRMSDPRFTWTDEQTASDASTVVATNEGTAPAEPIITIATAGGTVNAFNDTVGAQLQFSGVPAGDLVLDFAARTARVSDTDVDLATVPSDWWDRGRPGLARGANTIRQTGGTSLQVTWKHTSW